MKTVRIIILVFAAAAAFSSSFVSCAPEVDYSGHKKETQVDTSKLSPLYAEFLSDNIATKYFSLDMLSQMNYGAVAMMSCCAYYEYRLQQGRKAGQNWIYTNKNKYSPQSTSFDNMLASGLYGANCAMPSNWALIDMGVMPEGKRFYGGSGGSFANYSDVASYIAKAATVKSMGGKSKMKDLVADGTVLPGDIILANEHTFIYLGDDPMDTNDKDIYFCAGKNDAMGHRDATIECEYTGGAFVFDSFISYEKSDPDWSVWWIIRFKPSYVPEYYRNSEGKIVSNPMIIQ